jgi:hypothetical protein
MRETPLQERRALPTIGPGASCAASISMGFSASLAKATSMSTTSVTSHVSAQNTRLIRSVTCVGFVLLVNNPCHIKYVLVMGRRAEVENNEARQARLRVQQNPVDFKIISYDSLVEALHRKHPLYLGVRKNEYYEIHSTQFVGEYPFGEESVSVQLSDRGKNRCQFNYQTVKLN